jgi:hypothetical protein
MGIFNVDISVSQFYSPDVSDYQIPGLLGWRFGNALSLSAVRSALYNP